MTLFDVVLAWRGFGLIAYAIKLIKYWRDWKEEGNQVFFVAELIGALVFGPIGLLSTLIRARQSVQTDLATPRAPRAHQRRSDPLSTAAILSR